MKEPDESSACLGHGLRFFRRKKGLTQADVAEQIGRERTFVSDVERGKQRLWLEDAADLAIAVKADLGQLLEAGGWVGWTPEDRVPRRGLRSSTVALRSSYVEMDPNGEQTLDRLAVLGPFDEVQVLGSAEAIGDLLSAKARERFFDKASDYAQAFTLSRHVLVGEP